MSSLQNAVKRRAHKERAQPAARKKFGLLEKHKDYVVRAKDFHRKENTIKALKRKADERNPDEFYFGMEKKKTKDGVHDGRLTVQNKYSQAELQLMKTQDVKYLVLKERTETEKVRRLRSSLHLIGTQPEGGRNHTVFVDNTAEVGLGFTFYGQHVGTPPEGGTNHIVFLDYASEAADFSPESYFGTPAELLSRAHNRPREAQLLDTSIPEASGPVASKELKRSEKLRQAAYKELLQRAERLGKVAQTAARMAYDKQAMGKGRKRKLAPAELGVEAEGHETVYKWKRERKK